LSKYTSKELGLTLKGFKDFWRDSLKTLGEAKLREWLDKMGYDQDLYSSFSRSFIFTMHSE